MQRIRRKSKERVLREYNELVVGKEFYDALKLNEVFTCSIGLNNAVKHLLTEKDIAKIYMVGEYSDMLRYSVKNATNGMLRNTMYTDENDGENIRSRWHETLYPWLEYLHQEICLALLRDKAICDGAKILKILAPEPDEECCGEEDYYIQIDNKES